MEEEEGGGGERHAHLTIPASISVACQWHVSYKCQYDPTAATNGFPSSSSSPEKRYMLAFPLHLNGMSVTSASVA